MNSTNTPATTPSTSSSSALNSTAAALLWQQQLQSASGVDSVTAQALLKQQEDQLRATRLLLQQRQLDELMAMGSSSAASGSPPASRSNSILSRGGAGSAAGLLGLGSNQDALSALVAARRSSLQSVSSVVSEAAAKVAEEDPEEEDDVVDEEYFKSFAMKDGKEDQADDDKASNESFPHKLYRMLYESEQGGHEAIVSFLPSGRGFTIHKPKEFVAEIMPSYFTTRRIASFQRQLNLYGFRRISEGKEKGAYFHKDFMKGKRTRVQRIKRKSTASRPSPTSFAHRFATAPGFPFHTVPPAALYGGGLLTNSSPVINNATKELLLARYAGAAMAPSAVGAAPSLVEMTRKGLLGGVATGGASHQDILRNAAASLFLKNSTPGAPF